MLKVQSLEETALTTRTNQKNGYKKIQRIEDEKSRTDSFSLTNGAIELTTIYE